MAYDLDDTYSDKHSLIEVFFIRTADSNYITARWCSFNGLDLEYFWQSVHCLEKYMKAALVLNGKSAHGYHHNVVELFADVQLLAPEMLPATLTKPSMYGHTYWNGETPAQFIERLYQDGQADNRYALFGHVRHMDDVLKLDQVVFAIRRLCHPLEAHFLGEKSDGVPDESRRDWMARGDRSYDRLGSRLEETIDGRHGEGPRQALLNWNVPFAPADFVHGDFNYSTSSENPVLVRRIFEPLERGPAHFAKADKLWEWLKANVQIPKHLVKKIEDERDRFKAKSAANSARPRS